MRFNPSESTTSFLREVERFCKERTKSLRTAALVNPKRYPEWEGYWVLPKKKEELLLLAIWSWYCDDETMVLLRLQLQNLSERNSDLFFLRFAVESKDIMIEWLLKTNLWTTRSFFGAVLCQDNVVRTKLHIRPRWVSKKKPTKTVRRRGYKDKGSLRSSVHPNKFVDTTKENNRREEEEKRIQDTFNFLKGFLGEGLGDT